LIKVEEYPTPPEPKGEGGIELAPEALDQLLGAARFLSGGDEARPIDAVQLKWAPGEDGQARITATGTDGYKLFRSTVTGKSAEVGSALLTRRAIAALKLLINRAGEETITLTASQEKLFASVDKDRLWASQLTGTYPDLSEILKVVRAAKITGSVECKAFQKGVERSLLALKEEKGQTAQNALLTVESGRLCIAFSSQEAGSGEAVIPFQSDSQEKMTIPYHLNILNEVLNGLRAATKGVETLQLSLATPASPMILKAAAKHGPVLALVMPVAG
jgi:DNA polymerase III sliding clamp (beta) subunit (PCNA family)